MHLTKINRRISILLGVGLTLVLAGTLGILGPMTWLFDHTILPVSGRFASAGSATGQLFAELGEVRSLVAANQKLAQENAQLRQEVAGDDAMRRDNALLRTQLGLEAAGGPQEVGADVVSYDPDSYSQFVTIDKGSRNGIKPGMAVVSGGVLIGIINTSSPSTSEIELVTDPDFKLVADDQTTGADGLLAGQLGGGLVLDDIGQTDTVKPGDSVTTSGLGGDVPGGLLIGTVQSVSAGSNAVFKTAQVQTTFQVSKLRFAFVVVGQ